jgi:hypothetical protein
MTTLTTIDLDLLAGVTGGQQCQCMAQPQPQPGGDPGAGAQPGGPAPAAPGGGGGGFLSIVQAILGFLKSPQFGHIVNGASELVTAFAGDGGAQPQGDAGTQQA